MVWLFFMLLNGVSVFGCVSLFFDLMQFGV